MCMRVGAPPPDDESCSYCDQRSKDCEEGKHSCRGRVCGVRSRALADLPRAFACCLAASDEMIRRCGCGASGEVIGHACDTDSARAAR